MPTWVDRTGYGANPDPVVYAPPTEDQAAANVSAIQAGTWRSSPTPDTSPQHGPGGQPGGKVPTDGSQPDQATQDEINNLQQQLAAAQSQLQQQQANTQQNQMNAIQAVEAAFPWLQKMGLGDKIHDWVVQGFTDPSALVGLVRQTPEWQAMFPAIRRPDGTMRSDEATYLATQDQYLEAIKSFAPDRAAEYDNPAAYAALFNNNITPQELGTRLQTYDTLNRSSDDVKAAFYVYGGLNVSTDDLYKASVDPAYAAQLNQAYTQAIAVAPPDYQTFLNRATEFAVNSVAAKVAQATGSSTQVTTQQLQMMDPTDARSLMDQLYHGGNPQSGAYLNLSELQNAFENALIGGALTQSGLNLPNADLVQQWRQAGVDQAAAYKAGSDVFNDGGLYSGELARTHRGTGFSQTDLLSAEFGTDAQQKFLLQQAQQGEQALGQSSGGPSVSSGQVPGQLEQTGFLGRY